MITSPGCKVGASCVLTSRSNSSRFIHCPAVHVYMHERGPVDDPRRIQPIMAQGGDEGLSAPMADRHMIRQSRAFRSPAGGLGNVCL